MIRRDPTRIELKLDDIQEYERRKQELDAERIKRGLGQTTSLSSQQQQHEEDQKKTRSEIVRARIGFDPTQKN